MTAKTCLVLHRKSANRPEVKAAIKAVKSADIDVRVLVPWNKKEKPNIIQEAIERGATRIIAGGGDGTVNAATSALVGDGSKAPAAELGILPLGTANDFARGCGLPVDDLTRCLQIAATKPARPIDVGKVNKHYFLNVASAGFGAEITATTPQDIKNALGGAAYTLMGIVKAFNMQPYSGRLLIPGEEPLEGEMLFMAVGNNRFAGGGFDVAPLASMDDGLLDVAAVRMPKGFALAQLAQELDNPMNAENETLYYRQLSEFTIESDRKLHCNLDGEPILKKRLRFSVLPKFLQVVY